MLSCSGKNISDQLGLSPRAHKTPDTYDVNVNPTIANVFAACAFRFAHTLLPVNKSQSIPSGAGVLLFHFVLIFISIFRD